MEYTTVNEMMDKITLAISKNKKIVDGRIEGKWFIADIDSVKNDALQNYNLRIKVRMPI